MKRDISVSDVLRSLVLWFSGTVAMVFFASLAIIFGFFDKTGNLSHRISSVWARELLRLARIKVDVRGVENISKGGPYIIASNHQGLLDICLMAKGIPFNYKWIVKKELVAIPFFGPALMAAKYIAIDREDGRKAMKEMQKAEVFLKNGISVAIFPEGTRSLDGSVGEFKKGAFVLANRTKKPILPVTIDGSYNILVKGGFIVRPQKVIFTIHKPVDTASLTVEKRKALPEKIQQIVAHEVGMGD